MRPLTSHILSIDHEALSSRSHEAAASRLYVAEISRPKQRISSEIIA
jgi:hypothetical protein